MAATSKTIHMARSPTIHPYGRFRAGSKDADSGVTWANLGAAKPNSGEIRECDVSAPMRSATWRAACPPNVAQGIPQEEVEPTDAPGKGVQSSKGRVRTGAD